MSRKPFALLAAGGTGGHVFPAEALASELIGRGWRLGLATDRRGQAYGGTLGSLECFPIAAGGIAGRGILGKIKGVSELALGVLQARTILKQQRPDVVVGFGGYASVPALAAAEWLGLPTVIHEQNGVLGRANRLLAARVWRIATSYPQISHLDPAWSHKVVQTGMPVRAAIAALRDVDYPSLTADAPISVLVMGGSQGARILSEIVPAALIALPEALRRRLHVTQQCRPEDLEQVQQAYQGSGVTVTLSNFFADIPQRLASAHLVITRSGASTMAELTYLGRPAILVPYMHAIDDHQTANARALDQAGGAWLMPQADFSAAALTSRLSALFAQPDILSRAAACARNAGRPDAAQLLADLVSQTKELTP